MSNHVCGLCGKKITVVKPNTGYPAPRYWRGGPLRVTLYIDGCWEINFQ